jgi:hypothetical protein
MVGRGSLFRAKATLVKSKQPVKMGACSRLKDVFGGVFGFYGCFTECLLLLARLFKLMLEKQQ